MLIDSHVNLHAPQFAEDQAEVIARARAAGIGLMVTICDRISSFEAVHVIAMAHDDIWATGRSGNRARSLQCRSPSGGPPDRTSSQP